MRACDDDAKLGVRAMESGLVGLAKYGGHKVAPEAEKGSRAAQVNLFADIHGR